MTTSTAQKKTVPLIADLGPAGTINVGTCHPGQARILTKKGYADWQDGKLNLRLRSVHLDVAQNHPRLPDEDRSQVSNAELERRTAWLRRILEAVVNSDTHGSDIDKITGQSGAGPSPAQTLRSGHDHAQRILEQTHAAKGRDAFRLTFSGLKEGEGLVPPPDLTPEEIDEWYDESKEAPAVSLPIDLWDRDGINQMTGIAYTRDLITYDSRKSPIRTQEPPPYTPPTYNKLVEMMGPAAADILGPRAWVTGEDEPTWTEEFVGEPVDIKTLPVSFTFKATGRSPHSRWPSEYPGWPEAWPSEETEMMDPTSVLTAILSPWGAPVGGEPHVPLEADDGVPLPSGRDNVAVRLTALWHQERAEGEE